MARWSVWLAFLVISVPLWAHAVDSETAEAVARRWQPTVSFPSRDVAHKHVQNVLKVTTLNDVDLERRARELIQPLHMAFEALYPELLRNKVVPDLVVIDSNIWTDVRAIYDEKANPTRWVLAIPKAMLVGAPISKAAVLGILAHELAHAFLNHSNVEKVLLGVYSAKTGKPVNDERRLMALEQYHEFMSIAGKYPVEALAGFPSETGLLMNSIGDQIKEISRAGQARRDDYCGRGLWSEWETRLTLVRSRFDYFSYDLSSDPAAEIELSNGFSEMAERVRFCTKRLKLRVQLLRKNLISEQFFRDYLDPQFNWETHNEFDALLAVSAKFHAQMRGLVKAFGLKDLVRRTFESEADEFSVSVTRALEIDPREAARALLVTYDGKGYLLLKCEAAIQAKQYISPGFIGTLHAAPCFRLKTVTELASDPSFLAKP